MTTEEIVQIANLVWELIDMWRDNPPRTREERLETIRRYMDIHYERLPLPEEEEHE